MIGLQGNFVAYSNLRLQRINEETKLWVDNTADFNFFHGLTPWLKYKSNLPYAAYTDCCFATYIENYHHKAQFTTKQLNRLFEQESNFINNAQAIFFSSQWALEDTRKHYHITKNHLIYAGLGGGFNEQLQSTRNHSPYFLFVSNDFKGKGGDLVLSAFLQIHSSFPTFQLKIVGQPPNFTVQHPAIQYIGYINRSTQDGLNQLVEIFRNAYCFLLPTSKDMTPLVLIEALSVGCPVISMAGYGIPEIVEDGKSGYLLDLNKNTITQLKEKMAVICGDEELRNSLGAYGMQRMNERFTWDQVGLKINKVLTK